MLVLSRKRDESIIIGDQIRITIVQVHGSRVKLGIEAPDSIKIYRSELIDPQQPCAAPLNPPEDQADHLPVWTGQGVSG